VVSLYHTKAWRRLSVAVFSALSFFGFVLVLEMISNKNTQFGTTTTTTTTTNTHHSHFFYTLRARARVLRILDELERADKHTH
jgi:hypothetical protein